MSIVEITFLHYNTIVMNNQQGTIIIFVRINQQMWLNYRNRRYEDEVSIYYN